MYNITPVSPDQLNKFFINESTYNGKLEYSHFETSRDSYFLGRNKPEKVSRKKSDWEYFMEGINWLLDKNAISKEEYYQYAQMFSDVYEDEENADEESEVKAETPDLNRFIIANPYYVGNKYLTQLDKNHSK